MDILKSKVSFYTNIKDTANGESVELESILQSIQVGKWKEQIEKLRSEPDKQRQALLKKNLPNFTASGLFDSRKASALIQHSNVMVLDFDDVTDVKEAQHKIKNDPHLLFSFISCRGNGLAVGVPVDGNHHKESFQALEDHFKEHYGLLVDQSCKDVSRTRFISFDPELKINKEAKTFSIPEQKESKSTPAPSTDEAKYEWCKSVINKRHTYTDGNRHSYLFSLAGFANKVGIPQDYTLRRMADEFNTASKKPHEIASIVNHCYKRRDEFETIHYSPYVELPKSEDDEDVKAIYRYVHKMNRDGDPWTEKDVTYQADKFKISAEIVRNIFQFIFDNNKDEFGIKNKPAIIQVEVFLDKNYDFRKNVVNQQFEYRRKGEKEFKLIDPDSLFRALKHVNISYPLNQLTSLLQSDFIPEHNPFKEKFESLLVWDGKTDYITELANYVVTGDQKFFNIQFKKMLVRCIACSLFGVVNRIVFVLVSEKQEIGKSSFIRFLSPFGDDYYTEAPLRGDKDSEFRLSENFIYNLEELSSLNNVEVNSLKAIISKGLVKERRPYARQEVAAPRRCNFFGSTNKEEFLTDTSNTRWLCFTINDIDWEYSKKINMDQVWSQAYALYRDDFVFDLTKEEQAVREEVNRSHEVRSNESEWIGKFFTVVQSTDKYAEFMTLSEIEEYIQNQLNRPLKMHRMALGRAMTQLGFVKDRKKINGTQTRGYWVGIAAREESRSTNGIEPLINL